MFVCNQVELLHFQKARFLSEAAHKKKKKFQELKLNAEEDKKLTNYIKSDVTSLSTCNLVEFQELYCKQRLFVGINSGHFLVSLEFPTDIHDRVREWLKCYGYYLSPDKPIDYDAGWMAEVSNPTPESTTKFELRW